MTHPHTPAHLRRLAILLAMPEADARDTLHALIPVEPWLTAALAELNTLPLERWQAEHTRLFVNGYPKTPCPPFESAYRQGNLGGSTTADLQGLYQRAGLHATEAPADYLGTQLEFAAYLLDASQGDTSADCLVATLTAELWAEHLCRWLPRFAQDLHAQAELTLYRALAERLAQLCPATAQQNDDDDEH